MYVYSLLSFASGPFNFTSTSILCFILHQLVLDMTTSAYSDLIVRAEELVRAHMAKYVLRYPFVVANDIELSVFRYDPSHDWAHGGLVARCFQ